MSSAIESQGYTLQIGQGDATTVAAGSDSFDTFGEVKDWDGPSGSAAVIDVTHLGSTAKEKRIGLRDEGQYKVTFNRVFGDVGQESAVTARTNRTLRNFKATYSDGTIGSFTAFVMEFSIKGGVDGVIDGSMTLETSGAYTEA